MTGPAGAGSASGVSLRAATPDDMEFLSRVYASTRDEELAVTGWDDATKRTFLTQQFRAQHDYYRANYEHTDWDVVLVDDEPAGRLYVARWPETIRIVDISLLPGHRGRGIGERLIRTLLAEAVDTGKSVTIHVEHQNRAMSLYRRLGFEIVEDRGVYALMEWRPPARPDA